MLDSKTILGQFNGVRKEYKKAVLAAKKGKLADAWTGALAVGESFEELVQAFGRDYSKNFLERKAARFDDKKAVLETKPKGEINRDDVFELLIDLDGLLATLGRDINNHFSKPAWFKKYIWLVHLFIVLLVSLWALSVPRSKNNGVTGHYFDHMGYKGPFIQRIDKEIDFSWGRRPPLKNFKNDTFSVRWTGFLFAPDYGTYEFYFPANDGYKVWLGTTLIMKKWSYGDGERSAKVNLKRGYYPIRIDYFNRGSRGHANLMWECPSCDELQVIESKFLFPDTDRLKENSVVHADEVEIENPPDQNPQ